MPNVMARRMVSEHVRLRTAARKAELRAERRRERRRQRAAGPADRG